MNKLTVFQVQMSHSLILSGSQQQELERVINKERNHLSGNQVKAIITACGKQWEITMEGFIRRMRLTQVGPYLREVKSRGSHDREILAKAEKLLKSLQHFENLNRLMRWIRGSICMRYATWIKQVIWLTFINAKLAIDIRPQTKFLIELVKYFWEELLSKTYPFISHIRLSEAEQISYQQHLSFFKQLVLAAYCLKKRPDRREWQANDLGGIFSREPEEIIRFIDDMRLDLQTRLAALRFSPYDKQLDESCFLYLKTNLTPQVTRLENKSIQSSCSSLILQFDNNEFPATQSPISPGKRQELLETSSSPVRKLSPSRSPKITPFLQSQKARYRSSIASNMRDIAKSIQMDKSVQNQNQTPFEEN